MRKVLSFKLNIKDSKFGENWMWDIRETVRLIMV